MGIAERKEREKEQRRNDIINAAEKVFFEKGINGATMDEVADKAELSKGTLYLYFSNKDDLYYAICMRGLSILNDFIVNSVSGTNTIFENIIEIGRAYVKFAHEHENYFKVITHFDDVEIDFIEKNRQNPHMDDVMAFFIDLLEKGRTDGSIRRDLPAPLMAHLLWTQTTGVLKMLSAKRVHIESYNISEEEIIKGHFSIIADGINPKAEPISIPI